MGPRDRERRGTYYTSGATRIRIEWSLSLEHKPVWFIRVSDCLLASILFLLVSEELVLRPSTGSRWGDTSEMIASRSSRLKRSVQASNRSAEGKSSNAVLVHDVAARAFSLGLTRWVQRKDMRVAWIRRQVLKRRKCIGIIATIGRAV